MQIVDIATMVSTGIAIISAVTAYFSSKAANKYQAEAAQLLAKQHQVEINTWADQYFNSVRLWGDQVCLAMVEAAHFVEFNMTDKTIKLSILNRLSTLIDTGRWFFPNYLPDDNESQKKEAYRGKRQSILHFIVIVYDELKNEHSNENTRNKIIAARRDFVSSMQSVLDPRKREQKIQKVIEESEKTENQPNTQ
jgi:hypothetical protein